MAFRVIMKHIVLIATASCFIFAFSVSAQEIPWLSENTIKRMNYMNPPNLQVGYSNWTSAPSDSFSWFPNIPLECWTKGSRTGIQSALFLGYDVSTRPLDKEGFNRAITSLFNGCSVAIIESNDILFQRHFTAWSNTLLGSDGTGTFVVGGAIPTKTYIFALPLPRDSRSGYYPILLVVLYAQVNDFPSLKDEVVEFVNNIQVLTSLPLIPEMQRLESRFAQPLLFAEPEQIKRMVEIPYFK